MGNKKVSNIMEGVYSRVYNTWERKKDLGNIRKAVEKFEGRMSDKVRRQEKLDMTEKKDFRRKKLPGKYIAKILYG